MHTDKNTEQSKDNKSKESIDKTNADYPIDVIHSLMHWLSQVSISLINVVYKPIWSNNDKKKQLN